MRLVAAARSSVQLVATSLLIFCLDPVGVYHSSMGAGAESKDINVLCLGYVYAIHLMVIAVLLMVMSLAHLRSLQPSSISILSAGSTSCHTAAVQMLLVRCCCSRL